MPTKVLVMNLADITKELIGTPDSQIGGTITAEYDRDVNTTDGERVPRGLMQDVPITGGVVSTPVLCSDGDDIDEGSKGFRVVVRATLRNRTRPEMAVMTYTWKVSITTLSPDPVYLSTLREAQPVPPEYVDIKALIQDIKDHGLKGDPGHSPVLTWSGDQIAIDGVVSGPHLTGPGATDDVIEGLIADTTSLTRAQLDELFVAQTDLVPVPTVLPGYHQDWLIVPPGPITVTLGGDPLPGSLMVWSGGALVPSTLAARSLTFNAIAAENVIYYAYDGNKAAPGPVGSPLVIKDDFNRANSTTTLNRADTGQTWVVATNVSGGQPVWGISNNTAYCVNPATNDGYAWIEANTPDVVVEVKHTTTVSSSGLFVRGVDTSNGYTSNQSGLYKRVAGSNLPSTTWVITYSIPFNNGDTQRIVCSGSKLEVFNDVGSTGNFVSVGTGTDDTYTTATKHGFRTSNTSQRFDNFRIYGR